MVDWYYIFSILPLGVYSSPQTIYNVGTDPETTRDPGFISVPRECRLSCYVCHPIIAMYPLDTNASPTDNLRTTGGHGRERNTGISTSPDLRKKNGMIWKRGKINLARAKAKENKSTRSKERI
jgi:hypothetical protein